LLTSHFPLDSLPTAEGYARDQFFYRRSSRLYGRARRDRLQKGPSGALRRGLKVIEHVGDMRRLRGRTSAADLVHYQWLGLEQLDWRLLPPKRPRVWTAHDIFPREPRPGQIFARRRLLGRMDAVIVHSEHGAQRLYGEGGLEPERVRIIPHGAFEHLTALPDEAPLPPDLRDAGGPVVLFFGLIRPYKGVDTLIEAMAAVPEAELWVVGMPRIPLDPLRELADRTGARVRFVPRFVRDAELPAYFRRADLLVLPYREIDQSGVLYTGLAFKKPMIVTRVGGLSEVADRDGAALAVPPEDPEALAGAVRDLLKDADARRRLSEAAGRAASTIYSWDAIGRRTIDLYRELLGH
jgi:glycosyltransferase involved in cell wall biosynthesis